MTEANKTWRCYYAHSMSIYDTEREKKELLRIKKFFENVICPNNDIGSTTRGMRSYIKILKWADIVVVTEFKKHIGAGVYSEVKKALKKNIPVMCLRDGELYNVLDAVIVDRQDIKVRYAKLVIQE